MIACRCADPVHLPRVADHIGTEAQGLVAGYFPAEKFYMVDSAVRVRRLYPPVRQEFEPAAGPVRRMPGLGLIYILK